MAETFLAVSGDLPALRSLVVVKRILPHLSAQEQFVRMFFDEARIGALLDHPNIVRIIEVGRDEDGHFLVMEPVQGKSLSSVLRRAASRKRPLGHAQVAFIGGQAANGLGYAHALTDPQGAPLNIVHRDISPQNILVSFDGAVKVIDFGVASALGRITETVPGGLKGKIEYMSPEQASGDVADRRSDIFALGVVLWEALSGRRLFRRATELETMRAIFDQPIPRPPRAASVPPRLERIVMRALAKEPADRFQDAREMALLLQQHAFASDGFNLIQLATQMKSLFAADHTGWKAAVGAAVDLESKRPRRITASLSLATSLDPHTAGPTVALPISSRPETSYVANHDEEPSDGGESPAAKPAPPIGSLSGSRRWIAGSIVLLGLIFVASRLLFPRPGPTSMVPLLTTNTTKAPMILVPMPPSEPPTAGPAAAIAVHEISAPIPPAPRAAARAHGGPASRMTDLRKRAPNRKVAKAIAGKRRLAAAQRKSAPKVPAHHPETPTTTRPAWHDPFD